MRKRVPAAGPRLAAKGIEVEDTLVQVQALIAFATFSDWDLVVKARMPITWGVAVDLIDEGKTLEERALGYYLAVYGLAGALDGLPAAFATVARKLLDVIDVDDLLETDETLVRLLPFVSARLRGEEGLRDTAPA